MIRQPKPEERTQITPLIQTIIEDMELPIIKEVSLSTLHTMLEEAMLQENFRYSLYRRRNGCWSYLWISWTS